MVLSILVCQAGPYTLRLHFVISTQKEKFTLHNVFQIVHFLLKFGFNLPHQFTATVNTILILQKETVKRFLKQQFSLNNWSIYVATV